MSIDFIRPTIDGTHSWNQSESLTCPTLQTHPHHKPCPRPCTWRKASPRSVSQKCRRSWGPPAQVFVCFFVIFGVDVFCFWLHSLIPPLHLFLASTCLPRCARVQLRTRSKKVRRWCPDSGNIKKDAATGKGECCSREGLGIQAPSPCRRVRSRCGHCSPCCHPLRHACPSQ